MLYPAKRGNPTNTQRNLAASSPELKVLTWLLLVLLLLLPLVGLVSGSVGHTAADWPCPPRGAVILSPIHPFLAREVVEHFVKKNLKIGYSAGVVQECPIDSGEEGRSSSCRPVCGFRIKASSPGQERISRHLRSIGYQLN